MKVIAAAEATSNREQARVHNINESIIRRWRKDDKPDKILEADNLPKRIRASNSPAGQHFGVRSRVIGGGRKPDWADLEKEMCVWLDERNENRYVVSRMLIGAKARQLWEEKYMELEEDPNKPFTGSDGWVTSFMFRNGYSLREKTHEGQKIPKVLVPLLVSFFNYIRGYLAKNNIDQSHIYGCDETFVHFDNPGTKTIARRGEKTISLLTTGHEKMGVTVLLTATSDGKRRLPLVIFQGKGCTKEAKILKARRDVIVYYNDNGWMDDEVAEFWINKMFNDFERCYKRLLIWDAFRAHISAKTKAVLKRKKIDHAVIPGGCTGLIQTADVSWNRPFKCKMIKLFNAWIESGEKTFTKQNNVRACSKTQLVDMVLESWKSLDEEMICKSFFACGQAKTARPEDITCLKSGAPSELAFDLVSKGWDIAPEVLEIPEIEVDPFQDPNLGVEKTTEEGQSQQSEVESAPLYDDQALLEARPETLHGEVRQMSHDNPDVSDSVTFQSQQNEVESQQNEPESSPPPGQMEYIIRRKLACILSSSDSD